MAISDKIRIKDIAERAGVSVGTVDRVLHNRPNVSKLALEKVKQALKEVNYQPNMYASALAYNRSYKFYLIMPTHDSEAYWEEIEEGAKSAAYNFRDFHVDVKIVYYTRFEEKSFETIATECIDSTPEGVVIVPSETKSTTDFANKLHENNIPFVILDSYIPDLRPLSFFGQDSFSSGFFAAKMLMLIAKDDSEIMIMKPMKDGKVASKQQDNREVGFRHYMREHYPEIRINELILPLGNNDHNYDGILEDYFSKHTDTHNCITFCSKAHIVGDFLLRTNRRHVQIMGYDMIQRNAECLRQGAISFLIAQHAYMQGYRSIEALFRAIVLKEKVKPVNYMPIEILSKENVDFYQRTMI